MNRRDRILHEIVPEVLPSTYPAAKFRKLDAVWKPGAGYTTCGALPTYIAKKLGVSAANEKDGLLDYGLVTMRNAAILAGVWSHHFTSLRQDATRAGNTYHGPLPRPGDFYLLCSGPKHDAGCNCVGPTDPREAHRYIGAAIEHVGVIVSAMGTRWRTADAGQTMGVIDGKTIQGAAYVERTFDPATGFMTGELSRVGKPMRRLCGWMNADAYPFKS